MLYEIGCVDENGLIVRGGIKAPLLRVGKWIKNNLEVTPGVEYFAIPASDKAITEEEYEAECTAMADVDWKIEVEND